jgi:phosphatidylethanolamine/phosphatidyl-N-methylethanolamine N-methyltransferase
MYRVAANGSRRRESPAWLHFRRFLAHPVRLSSALPVSGTVARMVASKVLRASDEYVVELGAGTGAVTRALLAAGVPPEKLIAVEIDTEMADFLARTMPNLQVIEGSAADIGTMLPKETLGRIGTVICGVPLSMLYYADQQEIVDAMLALNPHDGRFLQYSYRLGSPLHAARLGLAGERLGFTLWNALPASVWAYRPISVAMQPASGLDDDDVGSPRRSVSG